jgi:hypothetical protein
MIIEGDFVMGSTSEGIVHGMVEHIMTEGGVYGVPGTEYAIQSMPPENPAMAVRIYKGGLSVILKLFLILYIAVLVTFIAPFAPDPSRYTVGALFTAAGGSYILASKLPSTNVFSLAEIINAFCIVLIVAMIAILGILPALIFKDGVIDSFEKKMTRLINLAMFLFFILINSSLIYFALSYS